MNKYNKRIWRVFLIFFIAFIIIDLRLFYLQIVKHEFYKKKSKAQQERIVPISAKRGDILDRNEELLATSLTAYSIYADTTEMKDRQQVVSALNAHLNINTAALLSRDSHFIWIKRKVSPEIKDKIKLPGIHFLPDIKRAYTCNGSAGQLLGFVNIDDEGISGLEYFMNKILKGKPGSMILENDPSGKSIYSYNQKIVSAKNGNKIQLTIDKNIQFMMENELKKVVTNFQADQGVAILMDLSNGEILGMANYPLYDPNNYFDYSDPKVFHNNAVGMAFEPGSIMKLFTMASAFEEHAIKVKQKLYIPASLVVGGSIIEEAHELESATKDISEILIKSLNVGAAMVGLKLGKDKLYKYLNLLEFGKKTGINLPGENIGTLTNSKGWREVDLGRISFGYTMSATPLQILKAASVFGNDGYLIEPRIIYNPKVKNKRYKRVYSERVTKIMRQLMQRTVDEGTGELTKIEGFTVGGKTGTARRFSGETNSYVPGSYNNSFVGMFPVSAPKFSLIVVIVNPRLNYFASQTAVPAFKGIASGVLRYYRYNPDNPVTSNISIARPKPFIIPFISPVTKNNEVTANTDLNVND